MHMHDTAMHWKFKGGNQTGGVYMHNLETGSLVPINSGTSEVIRFK